MNEQKLFIKKLYENVILPAYQTSGSAGMDICAFMEDDIDVIIRPGERVIVGTGLALQIPNGYEIQVRARSGISYKNGIILPNGIGTIDSDYRGELRVSLANISDESFSIHSGDRIAQIVLTKYTRADVIEVENLENTKRGAGAFGHTGV